MSIITRVTYLLWPSRYYTSEGAPIRCCNCGATEIGSDVKAIDCGFVSEAAHDCLRCGYPLAYDAYGSYDPAYRRIGPKLNWILRGHRA